MPFKGSCHCGAIRFTVDEDPPAKAMQCNCSICRCRAPLHYFTTPDKFTLGTPRDAVATYKWNTGNIGFHHCKTCACAPIAKGKGPTGPMVEISLRCAEDIDLATLGIEAFDGAHKLEPYQS